jgi:hypothetical protein
MIFINFRKIIFFNLILLYYTIFDLIWFYFILFYFDLVNQFNLIKLKYNV